MRASASYQNPNPYIISEFGHEFHAMIRKEIPAITDITHVVFSEQRSFTLYFPKEGITPDFALNVQRTPPELIGRTKWFPYSEAVPLLLTEYMSSDGTRVFVQYVPQMDTLFAYDGKYRK